MADSGHTEAMVQNGTVDMKAGGISGDFKVPPLKNEIKAVSLHSFGGPRSVKVENRPEPGMEKGQVLIRVKAT